ncbi:MAG: cytochrome PufQ [Pseudomonadota bacterium]
MSDHTSSEFDFETPVKKTPRTEFAVYFAIIFLATLPLSCLTWALSVLKNGNASGKGPIKRAWAQASIITPMIFSA